MLDVAGGRITVQEFAELLEGGSRAHAGRTAAAHGLALARVSYEQLDRPGRAARAQRSAQPSA
jgi:tRNA U38,U39,U40 pseudouridine synthase TruA